MKPVYSLKAPFESSCNIFIMALQKSCEILEVLDTCNAILGNIRFEILQPFVETASNNLFIYLPARHFTGTPSSSGICVRQEQGTLYTNIHNYIHICTYYRIARTIGGGYIWEIGDFRIYCRIIINHDIVKSWLRNTYSLNRLMMKSFLPSSILLIIFIGYEILYNLKELQTQK